MSDVAVIGGGPAGLMAAERLATGGHAVTVYDRMPSVARKFLLAGRGGLNLTHSESPDRLLARYREAAPSLEAALAGFSADDLRRWCEGLGIETFVGTSGRVFPRQLKASPLLRAWLRRLEALGVRVALRHHWTGFGEDGALLFETPDGPLALRSAAAVIALGGASWPRLGADGGWVAAFEAAGVGVAPLKPSNCGFVVRWSDHLVERFAGEPLKRAALSFGERTARGEAVITRDGIEGGLVYALSAPIRDAIERDGDAVVRLDLRPDLSASVLAAKLQAPRGGRSLSTHLRKAAGLAPVAVALLREGGPVDADPEALASAIKAVPLRFVATKAIDRAISTAGGVRFDGLDERFMLKSRPGVFVAGEMLDWEAPTGGYLLQASFSTGVAAAEGASAWAHQSPFG